MPLYRPVSSHVSLWDEIVCADVESSGGVSRINPIMVSQTREIKFCVSPGGIIGCGKESNIPILVHPLGRDAPSRVFCGV